MLERECGCGADISERHRNATRCEPCAAAWEIERPRQWRQKRRAAASVLHEVAAIATPSVDEFLEANAAAAMNTIRELAAGAASEPVRLRAALWIVERESQRQAAAPPVVDTADEEADHEVQIARLDELIERQREIAAYELEAAGRDASA